MKYMQSMRLQDFLCEVKGMKKGIIAALACALFVTAVPLTAKAWTGTPIRGYDNQENATPLTNGEAYFEEAIIEDKGYYYKFNTGAQDGVSLVSLESVVENSTASGQFTAKILDRYGSVISQQTVGGAGAAYRNDAGGRALDIMFPLNGLAKNEWYYICLSANDGNASASYPITNRLCVKFVSFLPAEGFTMKHEGNKLNFSWSNVQKANNYSTLSSFDGFCLELYADNVTKIKEIGNGGATSYSLSTTDPDLLSLGYPAKGVRIRLGCIQKYRSALEHTVTTTNCVYSNTVFVTEVVKKKTASAVSDLKYEITRVAGDGSGTVKLLGFTKTNNNIKNVKIGATVNIDGTTYKITEIDQKAFAGNKKIKTVEIGDNVTKIGTKAFDSCTSLKKITFRTRNLSSVGKNAFTNISKKTTVLSPDSKLRKKYKKLLKKKIVGGVKYKII